MAKVFIDKVTGVWGMFDDLVFVEMNDAEIEGLEDCNDSTLCVIAQTAIITGNTVNP